MERPAKRVKVETSDGHERRGESNRADIDVSQDIYLETVNRAQLDFDQEKICSVTLGNMNIYACLVCGKYFTGRSKSTPAFFHSLDDDHHVFLNLSTLKVYILPDSYENTNPVLQDIKNAVDPAYTPEIVASLDTSPDMCLDLERRPYRPGFVGLNNLKGHHHIGVLLHALAHIEPIRNHLLLHDHSDSPDLISSTSLLLRKMWSHRLLKAHQSPHEVIRRLSAIQPPFKSANHLQETWTFLINYIKQHTRSGTTSPASCFQGTLETQSQVVTATESQNRTRFEASSKITSVTSKFMFLTLDVPDTPLFKDTVEGSIVPHIALLDLLRKYDGQSVQEVPGSRRRFKVLRLPEFLTLQVARLNKSEFSVDRNPTIVNFPLRGLDLSGYVGGENVIYDLLVNVTHEVVVGIDRGTEESVYRIQVRDKATDKWMQMEGLFVQEIKRDMLNVGAPIVMQIWERRK